MTDNSKNRLVQTGDAQFKLSKNGGIHMLAYSGGIIKSHFYWGDLIIDLYGMSFPVSKYPLLQDHKSDQKLGWCGKPTIKDDGLHIHGNLLDTPTAQEFVKSSQGGFPYQASIYAKPLSVEKLESDEFTHVNGLEVSGPLTIWRECEFKEASICVFGWDSKTEASALNEDEEELEAENALIAQDLVALAREGSGGGSVSKESDDDAVVSDLLSSIGRD